MSKNNIDDLGAAFCQHYNAFQRLTFILARHNIITARELAEVYDELEEHDTQAAYELGRQHEREGKP